MRLVDLESPGSSADFGVVDGAGDFESSEMRVLLLLALAGIAYTQTRGCRLNPGDVNIARSGEADQSSLYSSRIAGYAHLAIDGFRDGHFHKGSCTQTRHQRNPWWKVDLKKPHKIGNIVVANRVDCCAKELLGAEVRVGNSPNNNKNPVCGVISTETPIATLCCGGMEGRYVSVGLPGFSKSLSLCEVEIYENVEGPPQPTQVPPSPPSHRRREYRKAINTDFTGKKKHTYRSRLTCDPMQFLPVLLVLGLLGRTHGCAPGEGAVNLARNGIATQSTNHFDNELGTAGKAIDGDDNVEFHYGSCTHTRDDHGPWWKVDLKKTYKVKTVIITNRRDCCETRLLGAEIRVGDSEDNKNPVCGTVTDVSSPKISFCCNGMEGRYVSVVIPTRVEHLTLCEVEVYEGEMEPEQICWESMKSIDRQNGDITTGGNSDCGLRFEVAKLRYLRRVPLCQLQSLLGKQIISIGPHFPPSLVPVCVDREWCLEAEYLALFEGSYALQCEPTDVTERAPEAAHCNWQDSGLEGSATLPLVLQPEPEEVKVGDHFWEEVFRVIMDRMQSPEFEAAVYGMQFLPVLLVLGLLGRTHGCAPGEGEANIARNGVATQSSNFNQNIAEKAIDGSDAPEFSELSCTHTQGGTPPWWKVDLNKTYKVNTIIVSNRRDCCETRLLGAEIRIGNSEDNNNPVCGTVTDVSRLKISFCCNGMEGRYVSVVIPTRAEYLTLCEVEVYGEEIQPEIATCCCLLISLQNICTFWAWGHQHCTHYSRPRWNGSRKDELLVREAWQLALVMLSVVVVGKNQETPALLRTPKKEY
ncbi:uncharacterized protein LOC128497775 [Spea bombifrons]|uniref:uncharacterized protein LOC128497775 n=1 Tax=Spea bombifrons TaxID=233779 RepID=UPI00234A15EF|nr:uncharacterized protein LOC128497775 [Spea bombifrons]